MFLVVFSLEPKREYTFLEAFDRCIQHGSKLGGGCLGFDSRARRGRAAGGRPRVKTQADTVSLEVQLTDGGRPAVSSAGGTSTLKRNARGVYRAL